MEHVKILSLEFITRERKYIYLCGPPPMMDAVEAILAQLKINKGLIIKEAV